MTEVITPYNEQGNPLSPYEARTGVVLPIWTERRGLANRHHPHFYKRHYEKGPRKIRPYLRTVRFTRLQLLDRGAHQDVHDFYDGTAPPGGFMKAFVTAVLNESGYVPPFVVNIDGKQPEIVETTPAMREHFRQPGILTIERSPFRRMEIGAFFMNYAIRQKLDHINRSLVEEFVGLTPRRITDNVKLESRREQLGMKLTNIAIGTAVEPFDRQFQQARDAQALKAGAQVCAFQEVKSYVAGHEPDYFGQLQTQLAKSA